MDEKRLIEAAQAACKLSYSPYSNYAVGAALLCEDGDIVQGANIENASYGLTVCAERNAIFRAKLEGKQGFSAICIAAKGAMPYPCGACRQVLSEFCPDLEVIVTDGERVEHTTLRALLPHSFGPYGEE